MSEKKKIISTIGLIIVFAFSFLIFFGLITKEKTGIDISAFIFVLLTELIAYINILFIKNRKINNTFTTAGLVSLTSIYCIISLIFNTILIGLFSTVRGILVFNFSILLIYLFISIIIFLFKKEA